MPRVVKEDDYAARRNEILDVARQLVYTKGYEQMSIQDILDALKISKGAFYHYFDSKQALLDGLIERMLDEAEQVLRPIVEAERLICHRKTSVLFRYRRTVESVAKIFYARLVSCMACRCKRHHAPEAGDRIHQTDCANAGRDRPAGDERRRVFHKIPGAIWEHVCGVITRV